MNHRLLHRWAREEALPLPSRTHPQTQKQTSAVYTEELTDLRHRQLQLTKPGTLGASFHRTVASDSSQGPGPRFYADLWPARNG